MDERLMIITRGCVQFLYYTVDREIYISQFGLSMESFGITDMEVAFIRDSLVTSQPLTTLL